MKGQAVYEVTPSSTNVGELAPPKLDIPSILSVQPIEAEYDKEYIIVERVDSRVIHCWKGWNWILCGSSLWTWE